MREYYPRLAPPGVKPRAQHYWRKSSFYSKAFRRYYLIKLALVRWLCSLSLPKTLDGLPLVWADGVAMKNSFSPRLFFAWLAFIVVSTVSRTVIGTSDLTYYAVMLGAFGLGTVGYIRRRYSTYSLWATGPSKDVVLLQYSPEETVWGYYRYDEKTGAWHFEARTSFPADDVAFWWNKDGTSPLQATLASQELENLMLDRVAKVVRAEVKV